VGSDVNSLQTAPFIISSFYVFQTKVAALSPPWV